MQDAIDQSQSESFVGRGREVAVFRGNPQAPKKKFVLNIHGDAGVGKTYLTRHLVSIAKEAGMAAAYTDDSLTDVLAVMNRIAKELDGQDGKRFRKFTDRYRDYEKHRAELEADPNAPDSTAVFLTRAAVKVGLGALQSVPVVGAVSGALDQKALTDQLVHWTTYVGRKFGNKETTDLVTKPVETLTPHFVEALFEIPEETEIALFFDTYERTSDFLDGWLRDLLQGKYGGLPYNVVLVIAGQLRLDPNSWSAWGNVIQDLPLEPFTAEEIAGFLAGKGITDPVVVAEISQLSNGLPLLVATLAENPPSSARARGATGTAVERFLKWEPDPARQQAAKDAALPRVVNLDVLATLVEKGKAAEILDWLRRMPFVSEHPDGYQYHQVVRSAMLRLKRRESPIAWTAMHDRLADAAVARRAELHGSEANWASEQWRRHVHDEVYHRLCARPERYLTTALEMVVDTVDALDTRPWGAVFTQAGQDVDAPSLVRWGELLRDTVKPQGWFKLFDALEAVPALPQVTKARIHAFRGLYRFDVDPAGEGAFEELDRAVEMAPDDPMVIGVRGMAHRSRGRYDQALADFERALELKPDYWMRVASRGETYRLMGDYEAAVRDFTLALEHERDSWTYNARGLAHFDAGFLDLAQADFENARELAPDEPGPESLIAFVRLRHGEHDVAVATMDDLVARFPDEAWLLVNRSMVYTAVNRVDEALADLRRAVELAPGDVASRQLLGGTFLESNRYAEAIEAYSAILEFDPGKDDRYLALANRGLARAESGDAAGALDDLSAALELYSEDVFVRKTRARVYSDLEKFEEALADIDRVLAVDPDPATLVLRAMTLQNAGRFDEAVAGFTEALGLDLEPHDRYLALANRGLARTETGDRTGALGDVNAALELFPDNLIVRRTRAHLHLDLEMFEEALADIDRVMAVESDPEIKIMRAMALDGTGATDEAIAGFTEALSLDLTEEGRVVCLMNRGLIHMARQEHDLAVVDFTAAQAITPGDERILEHQVDALALLDRYDEALAANAKRLAIAGDHHVVARLQRADVLRAAGRLAEALEEDRAAYELDHDVLGTLLAIANTLGLGANQADAIEYLTHVLSWTGPHYDVLIARANAHWMSDDYVAAYADLDAVEDLMPPDATEPHYLRARCLYEQERFDEAFAVLDRVEEVEPGSTAGLRAWWYFETKRFDDVLTLDPADSDVRRLRAEALVALDRLREAADEYAAMAEDYSWPSAFLIDRTNVLVRLGRFDEVLRVAEAVIAGSEINGDAFGVRAGERLRAGRFAEALADADAAVELEPRDDWKHGLRAAALHGLGRGEEAVAAAREALSLVVEHHGAQVEGRTALNRLWYRLLAREDPGEMPETTRAEYALALDDVRLVASILPVRDVLAELENRAGRAE
ncbi:tetratricopeptide repeat protein [Lentzea flava]|uniref:Tetratricopeptide (TPR) repeat n=1 Tax=Lentzea flava TaxID=103732 RepID=A0ABQ2UJA6_9PSEU|nr:tetratricopeptide repeat protein [Lentzea flava]GGU40554.1 hypothetical protein GCM10010178_36380 [Lentzea flava]